MDQREDGRETNGSDGERTSLGDVRITHEQSVEENAATMVQIVVDVN